MQNKEKKQESSFELLNEEEQSGLLTGENYIIFNNLHGVINVWVNCDEEMQVTITREDFIKLMPNLFPGMKHSQILELLNRGEYIYTDRTTVKPLRSKVNFDDFAVMPTVEDAMAQRKMNSVQFTPFGISLDIY